MYKIGEALIGDGDEIAHIDLVIGDKDGPVGAGFCGEYDWSLYWTYSTFNCY